MPDLPRPEEPWRLYQRKAMKNFVQSLIDGLDKTTEAGFAEALLIAISNLKNEQGLLLSVRLSDDTKQGIDFAIQIAQMMLNKGTSMKDDDDIQDYVRPWVGLTDEDYIKAFELCDFDKVAAFEFFEAKLKEKNS
jgi:hypothetical protein